MRLGLGASVLGLAVGCMACGGSSSSRAPGEVPATTRATLERAVDLPRPTVAPAGGTTVVVAGADAARALLYELLRALVAGDADGLRRILAEETVVVLALRLDGRVPTSVPRARRDASVQSLLTPHRAGRLPADVPLNAIVAPADIEVIPAAAAFAHGVPPGLEPGDLIVRFTLAEGLQRTVLSRTGDGRGLIVVRVEASGARVVGL